MVDYGATNPAVSAVCDIETSESGTALTFLNLECEYHYSVMLSYLWLNRSGCPPNGGIVCGKSSAISDHSGSTTGSVIPEFDDLFEGVARSHKIGSPRSCGWP